MVKFNQDAFDKGVNNTLGMKRLRKFIIRLWSRRPF
jgi:hypothetical protein